MKNKLTTQAFQVSLNISCKSFYFFVKTMIFINHTCIQYAYPQLYLHTRFPSNISI